MRDWVFIPNKASMKFELFKTTYLNGHESLVDILGHYFDIWLFPKLCLSVTCVPASLQVGHTLALLTCQGELFTWHQLYALHYTHLVIIIAWVYLVTYLQGVERTFRCTDKLPYFLLTYSPWPPTDHFGVLIMWRCTLEKRTKNGRRERKKRIDKRSREQTNRERILFSLLQEGSIYLWLMLQGTCKVRDTSTICHPYFLWDPNPHPGISVSSNLYNVLSFVFSLVWIRPTPGHRIPRLARKTWIKMNSWVSHHNRNYKVWALERMRVGGNSLVTAPNNNGFSDKCASWFLNTCGASDPR